MAGNGGLSSPDVGSMVPTGTLPDQTGQHKSSGYDSLGRKGMSGQQRVKEMGAGGPTGTESQLHRRPKLSRLSKLRCQGSQGTGSWAGNS